MLDLSFEYAEEVSQAIFKSYADATCYQINMNKETCSHTGTYGQQRLERYCSNTDVAKSKEPVREHLLKDEQRWRRFQNRTRAGEIWRTKRIATKRMWRSSLLSPWRSRSAD